MIMFGLAVLYRYAPSRHSPRWQWITVGSAFATVAWLAGSALLSFYLANFANRGLTYGSLGTAVGLLVYLYLSALVVLLGAEINAAVYDLREGQISENSGSAQV